MVAVWDIHLNAQRNTPDPRLLHRRREALGGREHLGALAELLRHREDH